MENRQHEFSPTIIYKEDDNENMPDSDSDQLSAPEVQVVDDNSSSE